VSTRIVVDGIEMEAGVGIAQAIERAAAERPPADRFLIVDAKGKPVTEVMWDGVSDFDPGEGLELHRTAEWKGEAWTGPEEAPEQRARRDVTDRLDVVLGHLRDDLKAFDTLTAQQRQAAQKRALRAVLLLAREVRGDHTWDVE